MENFYYRKLNVYQNARSLSKYINDLIKKFPPEERYALSDQLRRAAMSIPINIAEGFGRFSAKEKNHFIQIAYGSTTEVMCEIELAFDNNYISQEEFSFIENKIIVISKQLSKLSQSIRINGDYDSDKL